MTKKRVTKREQRQQEKDPSEKQERWTGLWPQIFDALQEEDPPAWALQFFPSDSEFWGEIWADYPEWFE